MIEDKTKIEWLASEFHEVYQKEARRQGDVRHKDNYYDLPENIKEFDRVLAKYAIQLLERYTRQLMGSNERAREMLKKATVKQVDKYTYKQILEFLEHEIVRK